MFQMNVERCSILRSVYILVGSEKKIKKLCKSLFMDGLWYGDKVNDDNEYVSPGWFMCSSGGFSFWFIACPLSIMNLHRTIVFKKISSSFKNEAFYIGFCGHEADHIARECHNGMLSEQILSLSKNMLPVSQTCFPSDSPLFAVSWLFLIYDLSQYFCWQVVRLLHIGQV